MDKITLDKKELLDILDVALGELQCYIADCAMKYGDYHRMTGLATNAYNKINQYAKTVTKTTEEKK